MSRYAADDRLIAEALSRFFDAGDARAEDALLRLLRPHAERRVASLLRGGGHDREGVVQEVLLKILGYLRRRGSYDGSLRPFVLKVSLNACIDAVAKGDRQRKYEPAADFGPWPAEEPDGAVETEQEILRLRGAFRRLDDRCQRLLYWIHFEGLPRVSLIERLSISSLQGVYDAEGRCLDKLRKLLKRDEFMGSSRAKAGGRVPPQNRPVTQTRKP